MAQGDDDRRVRTDEEKKQDEKNAYLLLSGYENCKTDMEKLEYIVDAFSADELSEMIIKAGNADVAKFSQEESEYIREELFDFLLPKKTENGIEIIDED
nr:hypothetical protein [Lachnospiraceae bacterium]